MKNIFIPFILSLCIANLHASVIISASGDYLASDSVTSSSTLVDSGLSVSMGGWTGQALVVSTYSSKKTNNSQNVIATYRLAYGSGYVGNFHYRDIQKSSAAAGAGSALGVINVTNSNPITLQFAENNSKSNLTLISGSTLSVLPLSGTGYSLNHAYQSNAAAVINSTSDFEQVAVTSSFAVPSARDGSSEIFVMASFDVQSDVSGNASWKLQVRNTSSGTWTDAGNIAQRAISSSEGIVTLVALAEADVAGTFEARLVHASDGTASLQTLNVDLVAVSLAIDDNNYLQTYTSGTIGSTGVTMDMATTQDMNLFAAANITARSLTSSANGIYHLALDNGTTTEDIARSTREVSSTMLGSVALAGIVTVSAANSNSLVLNVDNSNMLFTADSNLVAFGLTSVPEPETLALFLSLAALSLVLFRRCRSGIDRS